MARSETGSLREGTSDPSESSGTSERENSDGSISGLDGDTWDFDLFYGEYFDRRPRGPKDTTLGEAVAKAIMLARVDAETNPEDRHALDILENIKKEEDTFGNIPERLHEQSTHRRWHTQSAVVPEGRDPKKDQRQGAIVTRKDELRAIILELHFEGPDRCKEAAAGTSWGKAEDRCNLVSHYQRVSNQFQLVCSVWLWELCEKSLFLRSNKKLLSIWFCKCFLAAKICTGALGQIWKMRLWRGGDCSKSTSTKS